MKRRILSVLCITAMLLSLAAMPAFAEDAYKVFDEADFDETFCFNIDQDSTALGSDNGNKYLTSTSFYSLTGGPAKKTVVIDMRARSTNGNYSNLMVRDSNTATAYNRAISVEFKDSAWKYYRFIYNFETHTTESYSSPTGWGDLRKFSPKVKWATDNDSAYAADMSSVKFNVIDVDELKIYQYGSAPTAAATVKRNGSTLSAEYTYSDAEGDAQAGVKYQWQMSDDGITFTDIADATEQTYEAASAYSGKYIRCGVTPISSRYPSEGVQAYSNAVEYKEYTTYISQDFEGTDFTPFASGDTISDEVNTSKYLKLTGNQVDVSGLSVPTDETVVELRAKARATTANGGKSWFIVTFIGDKYWDNQTQYAVDGGADDWKYYRFVFKGKENPTFKAYTSSDRTEWKEADREVGYTSTTYKNERGKMDKIYQLRFGSCYIDDVRVYRYGTAPTGSDATVARDGDMLSAAFVFADAENDSMGAAKYQWQRSADGVSYEDIDGAVGSEYELCNADRGKYIRVKIVPVSCFYPTDGDEIEASFGAVNAFITSKIGVINYAVNNNTLTASAEVTRTAENETAMFVAAAYDSNGVLNKVMKSDVTDISNAVGINKDFDISGIADGSTIKLMLWRNMKTLAPLTGAVDVKK